VTDLAGPPIGREHELDLLGRLLEEASVGSPRFVFLTGEPGIGKTRLLEELLRQAEDRGCLALRGAAAEFEPDLPFGLVVDTFDEYLESLFPTAFNRLAAEDLSELAGVFPSLRGLDAGTHEPSTPAERFRAHRAIRELIAGLALTRPLVVVLDDLQWADGASLELASHLLRRRPEAPVLVAGSFRRGQVDHGFVSAIERATLEADGVSQIELGPLPRSDARRLIDVGPAEYERLYEASGGNPFYLLELARMGADKHTASLEDDIEVPVAVATAIRDELDSLSTSARLLAESAAVAGDPFDLDLAGASGAMAEPGVLDALDDLAAHDLVRPTEVPRRFHFRHPLVRRAVYEASTPGWRIAAHRRCAEALADRGAGATARAHHVQHSAHHGDVESVAVLREAGEAAGGRAPLSAARWFAVALDLVPTTAEPAERVSLLMALAGAHAATGRFEESRAALLEAIDLTGDEGGPHRLELIGTCAGVEQLLGHHEEARSRLLGALEALPDPSSPQAVELAIYLAVGDFFRMDYDGMRDWGERAELAAGRLGDPPLMAASTAVRAVAAAFTGAIPVAESCCDEVAALADSLPDEKLGLRLDALANLGTAELYLHRYANAAAHAGRGLELARATGQGDMSPILVPVLSAALHMSGEVRAAADLLDEAVEAARLSGNAQALGWNLLSRGFTAVAAGDLALALDAARESVDVTRDIDDSLVSTYAHLALAEALCERGEAEAAIDVLLGNAGGEELTRVPLGWRANYFELLTRCWIALRRPDRAERTAGQALATAAETGLTLPRGMAERGASAVALAMDDPGTAADRALAAAAAFDAIGTPVQAGRARTLAGRALAAAGERGRALAELEAAVAELEACGAVRFREEAEHELRKLGRRFVRRAPARGPEGDGAGALTARELDVAKLVVDRRTNPEIAQRLVLSEKTVETHMRNIFRKLRVSSRADVARTLERIDDFA
jgi:DNA-binding CsgD family transcriptional regulator/tetratricopeptide (TPR) repeat protein